ncbi:hypothetical protein JL721_11227 [Aureococcus anophagefferens]|nr:hypothetical protein JL721_11227 [Aureococcus anophagefferens]
MGAGASSKYQNPEYVAFMASWGSLEKLQALWSELDVNGNNMVSLAELDKLIVDDIEKKGGARFAGMDNKPALLRTYYATCSGGYEDDYIEKHEFRAMLRNLFFFTKLWTIFQEVDSSEKYKDRRITLPEFQRFCASNDLGLVPMSKHDAEYAAMEQPTTELGGDEACESCLVVPVNKTRRGKHGSKNKRRDKRFGASKSKLKREAKRFAKCTADFAEMQLNKKSLAGLGGARLQRQRHGQPRGDRQRDEFGASATSPPTLWDLFYEFDSSGDRRLDLAEFARGCASLGIELSAKELIKDSRLQKPPAPRASAMMRLPQELKGRVLDYLDLEEIMLKCGISRSFRAARACVESISYESSRLTSVAFVGWWRTALAHLAARRLSVDCSDDLLRFHCLFAALEREPFRARCLEVRLRVHVGALDTDASEPQLGRLPPLLRAGGLPALEVFDFEVYDDNCVHTGDVALWPPQPRLNVHPTVRAKLLQILDALPARVAVRSALALGAPADGILARIDAASLDLNESNARMDPCRNTDAIIHMPMAESEDEPSDDDSDARDEYYENRLDRLRMQTRLIYEGCDVKELSQSINLMSQTMHAMYTGAPLPAAGFLPLVTKEEDA